MGIGCSILENAVKPQPSLRFRGLLLCCSILENAVKPQLIFAPNAIFGRCSILENAVKPQPNIYASDRNIGCSILENAVKPQLQLNVITATLSCSILESAVKPQRQGQGNSWQHGCSILENAVKPQLNVVALKTLWKLFNLWQIRMIFGLIFKPWRRLASKFCGVAICGLMQARPLLACLSGEMMDGQERPFFRLMVFLQENVKNI